MRYIIGTYVIGSLGKLYKLATNVIKMSILVANIIAIPIIDAPLVTTQYYFIILE